MPAEPNLWVFDIAVANDTEGVPNATKDSEGVPNATKDSEGVPNATNSTLRIQMGYTRKHSCHDSALLLYGCKIEFLHTPIPNKVVGSVGFEPTTSSAPGSSVVFGNL
jgi:hypothetical protein